jgi:hypothetical protein
MITINIVHAIRAVLTPQLRWNMVPINEPASHAYQSSVSPLIIVCCLAMHGCLAALVRGGKSLVVAFVYLPWEPHLAVAIASRKRRAKAALNSRATTSLTVGTMRMRPSM